MTARRSVLLAVLALAAGIVPAGCDRDAAAPEAPSADAPTPVRRTAERDGTRLDVTLDRDTALVGAPFTLTIDVSALPGVEIRMPDLADDPGVFEILGAERPPDVPDGDARRWTHRYRLATFEPGTHEVPAVVVRIADRPDDGDAVRLAEVSVDAIPVEVESALADLDDASALLEMRGAVAVPVERPDVVPLLLLVALAHALAGTIAAIVIVVRAGRALRTVLPPAPHVVALAALDRLVADDLPARQDHLAYYVRLSDIVRTYVEARFRISAPEQTTEEFLRAARTHPLLGGPHRAPLEGFLRAADMVKFARHEPGRAECDAALAAARDFVETTAEVAEPREAAA